MPFISEESVLDVKRAVDITEVVRAYLPGLKKAGANYRALCPFHDEKTPSFNVHPEKGIYKCFGCGKAGDAISFVIEMEKCDYPEAIRVLAEKSGVVLKYEEKGGGPAGPRKEDLQRVNEWAAGWFRRQLAAPEAAHARTYLKGRGVTAGTEETFRLGWAPPGWETLIGAARKHAPPFGDDVLLAAGLVIEREGGRGIYDRFRNRLMFPITDPRGKVIAFGGRALSDEDNPKYLNTSETALFSKGRNFYGFDIARDELEKTRTIHIVEGYFDVILPWQNGVRGLVATLGTALTKDHLKLLRRHVDRVVLVFDGDAAGKRANERGLDLLLGENMDLFVAGLPPDEDPCDVVVEHGADRLRECLEARSEIFDFLVESVRAKHGDATTSARARVVDEIVDRVAVVPDPIKVEVLVRRLAERFKLDERAVRQGLQKRRVTGVVRVPALSESGGAGRVEGEPEEKPDHAEAVGRELLALMLERPALALRIRAEVAIDGFPGALARSVAARAYANPALAAGELLALLENAAERQLVATLMERAVDERKAQRNLEGCLDYLRSREFRVAAGSLREEARKARSADALDPVLRELVVKKQGAGLPRSLPGH